ncbi:glycosyltransferase family 9 protein [Spirosoma sp.]|uniref:glycosyltransferase family 9 protein n=1 Tax=Spirosoma sp. TaxID=1899569 RepID=UPI003B3AEA6C
MNLKALIRLLKTSPFLAPVLAIIDFVLWLTDTLAIWTAPAPIKPNTLLIIRLDVLGDYLLFRNYIRRIRESAHYKNYTITFCGNVAVKSLVEAFDTSVIDQFLWTDIYKLSTRPLYRFRFVRELRRAGCSVVFCPTYSRVLVLDDFMARASGAAERVGCRGNFINIKRWEAWFGNRIYTRLIDSPDDYMFEMERNRKLVEGFLQEPVTIEPPRFDLTKAHPISNLPTRYVVFSLGAGQDFRVWPTRRFAQVADFIQQYYPNHFIVLTGAPNELVYSQQFMRELTDHNRIDDRTGKLSLAELIFTLSKADLLIANETGILHLAASTQTPTVVISQGKSLVRWHPYPADVAPYIHHVYPDYIEKHRADLSVIADEFNPESPFSIETVEVDRVIRLIKTLLIYSD